MAAVSRLGLYGGSRGARSFTAVASCALTISVVTEEGIVAGGSVITLTLSGDTWLAAGTGPIGSTANTQAIIDGLTSAGAEAAGWNAEVRDKEVTTAVVRTSDTVATITLTAAPDYNITASETITATVPAAALTGGSACPAIPTFTIIPESLPAAGGGAGWKKAARPRFDKDGNRIWGDEKTPEVEETATEAENAAQIQQNAVEEQLIALREARDALAAEETKSRRMKARLRSLEMDISELEEARVQEAEQEEIDLLLLLLMAMG